MLDLQCVFCLKSRVPSTLCFFTGIYPVDDVCLFKVNNENTETICEICSKLIIKTTERCHWRHWTDFTYCSVVSIVNSEQVNPACMVNISLYFLSYLYSTSNFSSHASVSTFQTNCKLHAFLPLTLISDRIFENMIFS